jgi:hypothetical protein
MKKLILLSAFAAILAAGCKKDDSYAPTPGVGNSSSGSGSGSSSYSHECGYITQSGTPCKRIVKGPGYCWQHR